MPSNASMVLTGPSRAGAYALGFAELAGADSTGVIMANAAQAQLACQQIELSMVGVVCAKMIAALKG
jgi:hypothetical protein